MRTLGFEGIYPGLILANGARMDGIEANLFFTFFGMDAINREHYEHLEVATVGNPGLRIPTMLGGLAGMSSVVTHRMKKRMEELDIPPVPAFITLITDSGAKLYACKASVDMFALTRDDVIEEAEGVITVGEFCQLAAGGGTDHLHLIPVASQSARRKGRQTAEGAESRHGCLCALCVFWFVRFPAVRYRSAALALM